MAPARTPKSAAIYLRISKDTEGKEQGVDRQRDLCLALAESKGWPVGEVYQDNDISAFSGDTRPGYDRMLADLRAGVRDAVVVVDQDRLTRRMADLVDFMSLALEHGVTLATLQGTLDPTTTAGRFTAHIMGSVAEQESSQKADRVKRQQEEAARHGWATGGRRRYGYVNDRTAEGRATLTIVPKEAEVVRELARKYLKGESLSSLANDLNARGVKPVGSKKLVDGKRVLVQGTWRADGVGSLLDGPVIAGRRVRHGEHKSKGNWKPILDMPTWERIRAKRQRENTGRKGANPIYLLTGILKCSKCGHTLYHTSRTRETARYVCVSSAGDASCGGTSIKAESVETAVSEAIVKHLDSQLTLMELMDEAEQSEPVADIDGQIAAVTESLRRLSDKFFHPDSPLPEVEYDRLYADLSTRLSALEAEQATGQVPPRAVKAMRDTWETGDTTARREVATACLNQIVVMPGVRGRGNSVASERLTYEWVNDLS